MLFMLWRVSARLGGIGGVDFNVLGNLAELVRELEMNAGLIYDVKGDSTLGCRSLATQLQKQASLSTAGAARSSCR